MHITVFGGSQSAPGTAAYLEACELGKMLAEAGHSVLTGGYRGVMEAVSKGANEAGGHVIGVTCGEVEASHGVKVNAWVKEERHYATLRERLDILIQCCDAAMALPGGPGTLTEIALTWNLMIVASIQPKPLILIGAGWQKVFGEMYSSLGDYTPPWQRRFLQFTPDVQSAVKMLEGQKIEDRE
jgi:uncharacterized protein (TIGR00725 family)